MHTSLFNMITKVTLVNVNVQGIFQDILKKSSSLSILCSQDIHFSNLLAILLRLILLSYLLAFLLILTVYIPDISMYIRRLYDLILSFSLFYHAYDETIFTYYFLENTETCSHLNKWKKICLKL